MNANNVSNENHEWGAVKISELIWEPKPGAPVFKITEDCGIYGETREICFSSQEQLENYVKRKMNEERQKEKLISEKRVKQLKDMIRYFKPGYKVVGEYEQRYDIFDYDKDYEIKK